MKTVALVVNPLAGLGGAVGLKGTDNLDQEALLKGARPKAPSRATEALRKIPRESTRFLTCAGKMGEEECRKAGIEDFEVVYHNPDLTTRDHTRGACQAFLEHNVDLVVFCGGDGTARDVFDSIGRNIPILGIPAGVKMYSGVFAINPSSAAGVISRVGTIPVRDAEIVDVDEEEYRHGRLSTRLYGFAKTPYIPGKIAGSKQVFEEQDDERAKGEIARFIVEVIHGTPEIITILGPGTTTGKVAALLELKKTLLGFDIIRHGRVIAEDANEHEILSVLGKYPRARLVVSPLGAQGSVLGRGTQQVSPAVIEKVGIGNIIVVATPYKLSQTPEVFIDSGDPDLDRRFGETILVVSGYRVAQRKRILHPD